MNPCINWTNFLSRQFFFQQNQDIDMENTYELMHYMSGAGASIACCGVVHVDQWYDYEPTSEELSCTDTNTILGTIWL